MFYTIYKTTNLINGKFYIGKHKTKDLNDGYLGSGKLLKRAIEKYGIDNFHKEILHICKDEAHMNLLESILVVPDDDTNYNLCEGGKGGWSYVNKIITNDDRQITCNRQIFLEKIKSDENFRESFVSACKKASIKSAPKNSETNKKRYECGATNGFKGKSHDTDSKHKISLGSAKRMGANNGSYNTCWVTNGNENKKISKEELDSWLELGYTKGRKMSVAGLL